MVWCGAGWGDAVWDGAVWCGVWCGVGGCGEVWGGVGGCGAELWCGMVDWCVCGVAGPDETVQLGRLIVSYGVVINVKASAC